MSMNQCGGTATLDESVKTIVALLAFTEYAPPAHDQAAMQRDAAQLDSLPRTAQQHVTLRALFESPRFRDAGLRVLDLEPCRHRGDVLSRLAYIGKLAALRPDLGVVIVWSGHGKTFDRELRLATPECTDPIEAGDGLPAKEVVIVGGAKAAKHFCVFIDTCEAVGSVLEFSQVAATREWSPRATEHSFAAFYASYPSDHASDGVYLSLLARVLEQGPSAKAETHARNAWGNFAFSENDRLLSTEDIDQGIQAEILADPTAAKGVRIPGATMFGRQYLFPNPRYRGHARARMVDRRSLDTHFLPRARGIEFDDLGWQFAGRVEATHEILQWASAAAGTTPNVYVLTGEAGTGKSALLGRLIVLADAKARERVRDEGWDETKDGTLGTLPALGLFDAAVHLRNLTAQGVVEQLAELLELKRPDSPEKFVEKNAAPLGTDRCIVLDALDEAEDPASVALRVIVPLAKAGWRVLVATRPAARARGAEHLLVLLRSVSGEPRDLTADQHSAEDIADYVRNRIRAAQSPQFMDAPVLIEHAAIKIAERAEGRFLYARMATSNLLLGTEEITPQKLDTMLGADMARVLEHDLRTLDRAFQQYFRRKDQGATRLLQALAWGQGQGLPLRDGLWAAVASALSSFARGDTAPKFSDEHVLWALREAGRYIVEDGDGDQAVYRLFHQWLIDHFRPDSEAEFGAARAVATSLHRLVDEAGGWRESNPYLVRHMAAHWAACGAHAELNRLLLDLKFMQARLKNTGVHALLKDYTYVNDPQALAVARAARTLSMTAHTLQRDPEQLIPQLLGRLPPEDELCQLLREDARRAIVTPTLVPQLGGLRQPGSLIQIIEGHSAAVCSVAFSPNGTRLVTSSNDGTVRLWDARTGEPQSEPLRGHSNCVSSVAFSPDAAWLASAGYDGTVRLWNSDTGQAQGEPCRGHEGWVYSVAFSPDGTRMLSGGADGSIRLWDAHTGQAQGELPRAPERNALCVAYSPDGTLVASGDEAAVRIWDAPTGQPKHGPLQLPKGVAGSVAFSPDSRLVIAASREDGIRAWDARTGQAQGELAFIGAYVECVAFSPDGARVVSGDINGTVRLWNAHTGQPHGEPLGKHDGWINSVAFSSDGARVVSGGSDNTVRLWDARTSQAQDEVLPKGTHDVGVGVVTFSPDGTRMVSVSSDGALHLRDGHTGRALGEPMRGHQGRVHCVGFSPDGTRVISGGKDGSVRLWDAQTGRAQRQLFPKHRYEVNVVALGPDGTRAVSGGRDAKLRLWNACTGEELRVPLADHKYGVARVAFSPDGNQLVSGDRDGTARLWDARTGRLLGELVPKRVNGVCSVAFSPDSSRVASAGVDGIVQMWDAHTRHAHGEPMCGHDKRVTDIVFSPDGTQLVSGGSDGTVRLWDARTGQAQASLLPEHKHAVYSVAFSPDGAHVVSGGHDGTVRLWDAKTFRHLAVLHLDDSVIAFTFRGDKSPMRIVAWQVFMGELAFIDFVVPVAHPLVSTTT